MSPRMVPNIILIQLVVLAMDGIRKQNRLPVEIELQRTAFADMVGQELRLAGQQQLFHHERAAEQSEQNICGPEHFPVSLIQQITDATYNPV